MNNTAVVMPNVVRVVERDVRVHPDHRCDGDEEGRDRRRGVIDADLEEDLREDQDDERAEQRWKERRDEEQATARQKQLATAGALLVGRMGGRACSHDRAAHQGEGQVDER